MNSKSSLKAFHALATVNQSSKNPSLECCQLKNSVLIFFGISLRLYSDPLSKLSGFLLAVNSTYSDTMYVHNRH